MYIHVDMLRKKFSDAPPGQLAQLANQAAMEPQDEKPIERADGVIVNLFVGSDPAWRTRRAPKNWATLNPPQLCWTMQLSRTWSAWQGLVGSELFWLGHHDRCQLCTSEMM